MVWTCVKKKETIVRKRRQREIFSPKDSLLFFIPTFGCKFKQKAFIQSESTTQTSSIFFFFGHDSLLFFVFFPPPSRKQQIIHQKQTGKKLEHRRASRSGVGTPFLCPRSELQMDEVKCVKGLELFQSKPTPPSGESGEQQQKEKKEKKENTPKYKKITWTGYTSINRVESWGSDQRFDSHCLKSRCYGISIQFCCKSGPCLKRWCTSSKAEWDVPWQGSLETLNPRRFSCSPREYTKFVKRLREGGKQNGPRLHNVVVAVVVVLLVVLVLVVVQNARKEPKDCSIPILLVSFLCALGDHRFHSDIFIAIYI